MQKIKLKQVHLQGAKPLSRVDLGNVFGGAPPTSPGTGEGARGDYMCCNRNGCSTCVINASPACVEGAWPVPC